MNSKRLLSLLMTGAISAAMLASSASAATINMSGTAEGGYGAYRILNLEQGVKNGHADGDECDLTTEQGMKDHYSYLYTFNDAHGDAVRAAIRSTGSDLADASDADLIAALEQFTPEQVRSFADAVFAAIGNKDADETASGSSFANVADGYYLIFEKTPAGEGDSVSLVMLDTAGKDVINVTSKEDVPQLTKKIVDGGFESGNRQDSDLVAKDDTVNYEIKVTAPKKDILDQYDTYKYVIHDDISAGLSLNADTVKCYVNGAEVDASAYRVLTNQADGCELEVVFDNVKPVLADATELVLQYSCTVTAAAVPGEPGNPNTAHLEFSNNPYVSEDTTVTPSDKVAAFTFALQVNKTDGAGEALAGAKFRLEKKNAEGEYVTVIEEMTAVEGSGGTQFALSGLDVGDYKLVETQTPAGYQKIDDVTFTLTGEAELDSADPQLTKFDVMRDDTSITGGDDAEFTATKANGLALTKVVNVTGNRLPTTGGSGTYLLYAGGAVLLLVGGTLVVLRKKKGGAEA